MSIINFLELKEKLEIQKYVKPQTLDKKNHIFFSGSPRKHPYEQTRIILITDPLSENTFFYEFNIEDVAFAEELPSISNLKGDSVSMVRIWVKKRSIGLQCTPFIVDTLTR
ncbi:MAG: inorganic pyrophosphatase Ppa [Deltaproteobacteria bacterium]|nr:MAG: inorganic pyrophosphatase Ppa [Deltaproteobacteria bacterium]RLC22976.1 MAG: inorganic pyrophosphatase Ppa [Deltaproteobacteria bacterium]